MTTATFHLLPADALAPEALHAACASAYGDYIAGPFTLPLAQWPTFVARQAADLAESRVAVAPGGEVLAFAFVAPRPRVDRWRLAGMGAVPTARGQGAAPALLDDFVRRAAAAGQRAVELEVFAQNDRAVRLYRGRGFEVRQALHGFERAAGVAAPARASTDGEVREAGRDAALAWLEAAEVALPDLPLQVGAAPLRAATQPWAAWQHGSAQLVHAVTPAGAVLVSSLVDTDAAQHSAQVLVEALLARHRGAAVQVPQLQRDDVGGAALRRAGFTPLPLHQLLMVRALA